MSTMTRVHRHPQDLPTVSSPSSSNNMPPSPPTATAAATPSPIPGSRIGSLTTARDPNLRDQGVTSPSIEEGTEKSSDHHSSGPLEHGPKSDANGAQKLWNGSLQAPALASNARLRIHFEDVAHPGVAEFLAVMPVPTLLQAAISNVQKHLFTPSGKQPDASQISASPTSPNASPTATFFPTSSSSLAPPQKPIRRPEKWTPQEVRSVTLAIRSMGGVAYTTGTDLDDAHKEIHLSISYLDQVLKSSGEKLNKPEADEAFRFELMGVVTHEMVHAFQHNACSTCPGGLIEGIADYVRMKSGLGASHWNPWPASKKTRGEKWDEGYQKTAWFLDWVEKQTAMGVVGRLNFEMRNRSWADGDLWKDVVGESVKDMWHRYECSWDEMNRRHEKEKEEQEAAERRTHHNGVWL